ncbi:hypothetical protein [Salinigranum halophilum]|uniref:hypothetical protein n=1 Tax=Salinigranum halophilum TaxID=2565931 RepID=UPI00115D79E4|nr:hypothetical protein [Salinigranum halophilum]
MTKRSLSREERIGRLEGINRHLEDLQGKNYSWLHLPNIFAHDPVAEEPFVLSSSFIPESIGGSVSVVETEDGEVLAQENLNQMLSNFLPGGYKQRWKRFDLWQGDWRVIHDGTGVVNVQPMFEVKETSWLSEEIGDVGAEQYTGLELDPDEVLVYIPRTIRVKQLQKRNVEYYWSVDYQVVTAGGEPPGKYLRLGDSDPTTNYLWFKHLVSERDGTPLALAPTNDIVVDGTYLLDVEFLRCYYTSLLTLYEKDTNKTLSRTIRYRHGTGGPPAFVGSREKSQALLFDLQRETIRERIATVLDDSEPLKRDLQFAFLYRLVWDHLFFEAQGEILDHVYEVGPFVDHLRAVDYRSKLRKPAGNGVFDESLEDIEVTLGELLSDEAETRLTQMGYASVDESHIFDVIHTYEGIVEELLKKVDDEAALLDFAEEVFVHSAEHALSAWATEETAAGVDFELWYDVNFQATETETTPVGVYDSIQGGSGIADEIHERLLETPDIDLDTAIERQGECHTAVTDRIVIELLGDADSQFLFEEFWEHRQRFEDRLDQVISSAIGAEVDAYNESDLLLHVGNRIRTLLETRELARFNTYVAGEYEGVAETIDRTPRAVDLVLHLDQHYFRDPRIRSTYEQFTDASSRRDLSELAERVGELTMQCVTACPDCLEVDTPTCIHGMKYQSQLLNRKLLQAVIE